jgi:hypothetical protein
MCDIKGSNQLHLVLLGESGRSSYLQSDRKERGPAMGEHIRLQFSLRTLIVGFVAISVLVAVGAKRLQEYWYSRSRVVPTVFDVATGKNILWRARAGTLSFVGPIAHQDNVYVGTNNGAGYITRYPVIVDLGVLLCFDAVNGQLLWQASSEKLATGRDHDWPQIGVVSTPAFKKDRLWYVTNRCEVVCLDIAGYHDGEDDGVRWALTEAPEAIEADTVWKYDMIAELGVHPHNVSASSPCLAGNKIFVVTGNALDESHVNIPALRRRASLLWTSRQASCCGPTPHPVKMSYMANGVRRRMELFVECHR